MASKAAVEVCKLYYKTPDMAPVTAVALLAEQNIAMTEALATAWKRDFGSIVEALKELNAFAGPAPTAIPKAKKVRPPSRAARWADACTDALDAIERLKGLQEEYSDWKDNLPESLQSSPVGEKLEEVCGLDLEGAQSTVEEAEGLDLPQGFGRD